MKLNVDRKFQILNEMVKQQRQHNQENKSTGKVINMDEFQQKIQNTRNDLRIFDPTKHMNGNQVVCSNWDFVKVKFLINC